MTAGDVGAVAALRASAVPTSDFSRLGAAAQRSFFDAAMHDPGTFGVVAEDRDGVVAFALATVSAARIERAAIIRHPAAWGGAIAAGFRSPMALIRVAVRAGRVLLARRATAPSAEPRLRLLDIAVDERARGAGVGRAVLAATIAEAWARGHDAIGLSVLTDNHPAIRLYEGLGFVISGTAARGDGRAFVTMRLDRRSARDGHPAASHDGPAEEG